MDHESHNLPAGPDPASPLDPSTEENAAPEDAPVTDVSSLPINRIRDVRVEQDGVQIITSTLQQLLDVEAIVAGDGSVQFIGTTTDATLQEVARACLIRQANTPGFSGRMQAQATNFGTAYGSGRPLG